MKYLVKAFSCKGVGRYTSNYNQRAPSTQPSTLFARFQAAKGNLRRGNRLRNKANMQHLQHLRPLRLEKATLFKTQLDCLKVKTVFVEKVFSEKVFSEKRAPDERKKL